MFGLFYSSTEIGTLKDGIAGEGGMIYIKYTGGERMAQNWFSPRREARLKVEKRNCPANYENISSMVDRLEPYQFAWAQFRFLEWEGRYRPDDLYLSCPPELHAILKDGMTGMAVYKGMKLLSFQPDTPESETK